MSMNPHAQRTEAALELAASIIGANTRSVALAAIEAQANLAIAYEERTTNLINYLFHADGDDYETVKELIQERLGLK